MVGTGLGLNQFEAHFDSSLSPMVPSLGNSSGPSSFTPRSVFEGSFSPVGVLGCTKLVQKMILKLSTDRKSFVSSNLVSGGLVSVDTRIVLLEFVPRLVGPPFPEFFLEFLRVGLVGFGALGQEANSFSCKDLLCLSGEVMLMEEVGDFSVGVGEIELTDCLPLRIIALSASSTSIELEEVTKVMSMETKLNISGWVKHRIPSFCKLVGLSMSRHEKLCIALLQRLETEMEAANVLYQKATSSKKVAMSKNEGCRELQNLFSLVNYDGR